MGECGCGDYNADLRFKGPDGITYVLQVYQSCSECCTPAGVLIYAFNDEQYKLWNCGELPEIEFDEGGTGIAVVDPEALKELMAKLYEKDSEQAIVCEDGIDHCFPDAVFKQIEETRERFRDLAAQAGRR
jgi:hypothetical protein